VCGWRTYLGEVLRDENGDPVRGVWERILTEEQHLALMAALRPPATVTVPRRGRGHATKRLLSPFLRCGMCNAKMTGATRKDMRTGQRIVIYKCLSKGFGGYGRVSRPDR
jgi:site-specific DNA recombinase